jgi:hypothetical protein
MRKLEAGDIFPFVSLISKIGLKDIAKCFNKERLTRIVEDVQKDGIEETATSMTDEIGMDVAIEIMDVIFSNAGKCKNEFFDFLASLIGEDKEIAIHMSLDELVNLILEFIKKPELESFIKVASKLIK